MARSFIANIHSSNQLNCRIRNKGELPVLSLSLNFQTLGYYNNLAIL